MIDDIQQMLDRYAEWLKERTTVREVEGWAEITTPYLDRHNDCLQIYARRENGGFLLTDDGYTLDDLKQSGCDLETPRRRDLLRMTLNGFGVQMEGGALQVRANEHNFAPKKHNLLQAMLAVNDLFYLAPPLVTSLFYEDVVAWLDRNEIRYIQGAKFTGRSGYDHSFDFVVPKSRQKPERILRAITRPSRQSAQTVAFAWNDARDVRPPDAQAYAFLNDAEHAIPAGVPEALASYGVRPVPWSRRDEVREELAA